MIKRLLFRLFLTFFLESPVCSRYSAPFSHRPTGIALRPFRRSVSKPKVKFHFETLLCRLCCERIRRYTLALIIISDNNFYNDVQICFLFLFLFFSISSKMCKIRITFEDIWRLWFQIVPSSSTSCTKDLGRWVQLECIRQTEGEDYYIKRFQG